jgi:hypothetical protein
MASRLTPSKSKQASKPAQSLASLFNLSVAKWAYITLGSGTGSYLTEGFGSAQAGLTGGLVGLSVWVGESEVAFSDFIGYLAAWVPTPR